MQTDRKPIATAGNQPSSIVPEQQQKHKPKQSSPPTDFGIIRQQPAAIPNIAELVSRRYVKLFPAQSNFPEVAVSAAGFRPMGRSIPI